MTNSRNHHSSYYSPMSTPTEDATAWIGRSEHVHDALAATQAQAAAAMFEHESSTLRDGNLLPPLWHWFYFLPRAPQSELSDDGHPARGGFMPPIALPRRMFAGSRLRVLTPLRLGLPASREAVILKVTHKEGRSGALAFVTVQVRVRQGDALCLEEEQDIVYREPGAPVAAPVEVAWPDPPADATVRDVVPDSRLLFRFSALTFNAHRIHYDREYARREEGYPGLVVHGPLTAMLLAQLAETQEHARARHEGRQPRVLSAFSFRGLSPLFDLAPFRLVATTEGANTALIALAPDGREALRAEATFAA